MSDLLWAKVKEDAVIPSKKSEDAGYDLFPCFEEDYIIIMPHTNKLIPTGIASAFSEDKVGLIEERGSTGFNNMARRAGVIDSGFRGEWKVIINNTNDIPIVIAKERNKFSHILEDYIDFPYRKAIAQVLFIDLAEFKEEKVISYEDLLEISSERGVDMLGSTDNLEVNE